MEEIGDGFPHTVWQHWWQKTYEDKVFVSVWKSKWRSCRFAEVDLQKQGPYLFEMLCPPCEFISQHVNAIIEEA